MNKIVILDNGHGQETPGKRSPDGLFREYRWTREFVIRLKEKLEMCGYTVFDIVPELTDIGLSKRAARANKICDEYGVDNCIFISIHCNAAGSDGRWYNASGWSAWTTEGDDNSDRLAEILCEECEVEGIKLRKDESDGDKDWEQNFTVIYKTNCPAVLTENMFMDNHSDVEFLNSEEGVERLLRIHLFGIRRWFEDRTGSHNSWLAQQIQPKCDLK